MIRERKQVTLDMTANHLLLLLHGVRVDVSAARPRLHDHGLRDRVLNSHGRLGEGALLRGRAERHWRGVVPAGAGRVRGQGTCRKIEMKMSNLIWKKTIAPK
jgi:hypothetical protein